MIEKDSVVDYLILVNLVLYGNGSYKMALSCIDAFEVILSDWSDACTGLSRKYGKLFFFLHIFVLDGEL